ncbi:hypothetical protein CASFOL_000498 [Castilleja foliolosa]|uniref:Uncharacterized protein n=1 Tax=Castilleja foliolosa TaxID=1961234 RepID=A0ABD3ENU7_9LAMI
MKLNKTDTKARELTYSDAPSAFVWDKYAKVWKSRQKNHSIGRLYFVPPGCGDNYYLRCLLTVVRGATCFEDYIKYNNVQYASFREACYASGLLGDDREYIDGIVEASQWASARALRYLFVSLLLTPLPGQVRYGVRPGNIYLMISFTSNVEPFKIQLSESAIQNLALIEIEKLLKQQSKSLRDYESMPFPDNVGADVGHSRLVSDELNYDSKALALEHTRLISNMTTEQKVCIHR